MKTQKNRRKKSKLESPDTEITRAFIFNYDPEFELLRECLVIAQKYQKRKCEITLQQISEMAPHLNDAIEWAKSYSAEKTSKEIEKLERWKSSLNTLIDEIERVSPGFRAVAPLKEAVAWINLQKGFVYSERLRRHIRPYNHLNEKTKKPSIEKAESHLVDLIKNPAKDLKFNAKDTKYKPMYNFFHTASKIIGEAEGRTVFLGIVFDRIHRKIILNKKPTGDDPIMIYNKKVKDIIRKGSSLS